PEEFPLYGTLLSSTEDFNFTNVRLGTYYLMVPSVSWEMQAMDILLPHSTLRTCSKKLIVVKHASLVLHQQVILYPPKLDDPSIFVSLPSLMNRFLNRVREHSN